MSPILWTAIAIAIACPVAILIIARARAAKTPPCRRPVSDDDLRRRLEAHVYPLHRQPRR